MVLCDNAAITQFSGSTFFLCFSLNEFCEEKKKKKKKKAQHCTDGSG